MPARSGNGSMRSAAPGHGVYSCAGRSAAGGADLPDRAGTQCARPAGGRLSSPSPNGFVSLAYTKKRAHTRTGKAMRVRAGGIATPAGLVNLAVRLMEPARQAAGSDALWVGTDRDGLRAWFDTRYELTSPLRAWARRHGWFSWPTTAAARSGSTRRIRKSVRSRRYLQSGGVLDDFAAGHTKAVAADTTPTSTRTTHCMIRRSKTGCARHWRWRARPGHRHRDR